MRRFKKFLLRFQGVRSAGLLFSRKTPYNISTHNHSCEGMSSSYESRHQSSKSSSSKHYRHRTRSRSPLPRSSSSSKRSSSARKEDRSSKKEDRSTVNMRDDDSRRSDSRSSGSKSSRREWAVKKEKPEWGKPRDAPSKKDDKEDDEPVEREKPCFEPSGKLAEDTNTYKGVVIKYNEPPDAKMPKIRWRLYPFKGDEHLPVIYIHRQSAYLIGRERRVVDFPIDHPSCSKQHAALQYRSVPYERPDGKRGRRTRPYIIDLNSGNGTYLNGERIQTQRYYELRERDVLKFGFSSREYVVLNEFSAEAGDDDDRSEGSDDDGAGVDNTGAERRFDDDDDLF